MIALRAWQSPLVLVDMEPVPRTTGAKRNRNEMEIAIGKWTESKPATPF